MTETIRSVPSRLLSGRKGTRFVSKRDARGLQRGQLVQSAGEFFRVAGFIARTGDVVLNPETGDARHEA